MTKPLASGVLLLLACVSARAGTFVEFSRTDLVNLLRAPETQKLWFDAGQLRIENERADAVEIFKDETLYLIEPQQKRYTVLEGGRAGGGASFTLADAATAPTPGASPRAAATAVLANFGRSSEAAAPGGIGGLEPTARTETVDGRTCRIFELGRDGEKEQEWCVVAASALPDGAELQSTMRAVGMRLARALEHLSGASREGIAGCWVGLQAIDGVPLLTRLFQGGHAVVEFRLTGLRVEPVPVTAFEIPADYRRHALGTHSGLTAGDRTAGSTHSRHSGS
ncbi:MAG TPA: hypothetical protein VME21_10845 [Steroidobacteraceae bacterium]|nr:hypothetical protein [Steroidobacteraceae bacterium]